MQSLLSSDRRVSGQRGTATAGSSDSRSTREFTGSGAGHRVAGWRPGRWQQWQQCTATAAHEPTKSTNRGRNSDPGPYKAAFSGSNCCTSAAHCCTSATLLPINPRTMRRTSPRLRPTLRVLQGGGAYLCYDCLKKAKRPAMVQPLPWVLDHRTFERTKVELGRCDVCGMGKAVYRSRSTKSSPVAGFPMGNVLHPIRTLYNDSVMFQHFAAMGDQPIQCWKQANR